MTPKETSHVQPRKPLHDDRGTLEDLMQVVPSEGIIEFLRTFSFGNTYRQDVIDPLYEFIDFRGGPEHEFINPELERLRKGLREAIQTFLSVLRKNTFRQRESGSSHTVCRIPDEWEMTQGRRYHQAIKEMNEAAENVCQRYDDLVRTARAKSSIDGEAETLPAKNETRVDRTLSWAKNNRLVSLLIVFAIVVAGIATLLTNLSSIIDHFRSEHVVVLVAKLTSDEVSYDGVTAKDEIVVQFEPKDARQKLQQVVLDFPTRENAPTQRRTVTPPFKADVGLQLFEMNGVLQPLIPHEDLHEPNHVWICTDSVPVLLSVEYLTSSGELQTEKLLYEMDFYYTALQRCDVVGGCIHDRWTVGLRNFRYTRRLGNNDDPQAIVNRELSNRQFKFAPGY